MAEYQNIFTRVQIHGPADMGVPMRDSSFSREGTPQFVRLLGRIGDAQIGPIYLGFLGIASLICGFIAFEIIGLNQEVVDKCFTGASTKRSNSAKATIASKWFLISSRRMPRIAPLRKIFSRPVSSG